MKKFFKIILIIIAVFLAVLTTLFFIPDEELSDTSHRWLIIPTEYEPDNNIFNGLQAFTVEEGKDFIQEGFHHIKTINRKISNYRSEHGWIDDNLSLFDLQDKSNKKILETTFFQDYICYANEKNCLDFWTKEHTTLHDLISKNLTLIHRKEKLYTLTSFTTTLTSDILSPIPEIKEYQGISLLLLNASASEYLTVYNIKALRPITNEIKFNRVLLAETDSLVFKMLAINLMNISINTLSQLLDKASSVEHFPPLNLLTEKEILLEKPLQAEFRLASHITKVINEYTTSPEFGEVSPTIRKILLKPIYKPNHLLNKLSQQYKKTIDLSKENSFEFNKKIKSNNFPQPSALEYIKNPAGMILASVSNTSMHDYIGRMHELNGLITLYNLKRNILLNEIEIKDLNTYLNSKANEFFDPFKNEAIKYNADTKELYFDTPASYSNANKLYLDLSL